VVHYFASFRRRHDGTKETRKALCDLLFSSYLGTLIGVSRRQSDEWESAYLWQDPELDPVHSLGKWASSRDALHGRATKCYNPNMETVQSIAAESAILARVIAPKNGDLPAPAAQALLGLSFPPDDVERMNALAEKNRHGKATEEELAELEHYSRVGNLINLLQSKARSSLANG